MSMSRRIPCKAVSSWQGCPPSWLFGQTQELKGFHGDVAATQELWDKLDLDLDRKRGSVNNAGRSINLKNILRSAILLLSGSGTLQI